MGLINQDNRVKRDLTGTRTSEDVMRRLAKNVQITTDEVKGLTVEVSGKVGNDEIISRINQSAEAVTIDANKININGTISANGNFKIDTAGNMTCNNANITGGSINMTSTARNPAFTLQSSEYPALHTEVTGGSLGIYERTYQDGQVTVYTPRCAMSYSKLGNYSTFALDGLQSYANIGTRYVDNNPVSSLSLYDNNGGMIEVANFAGKNTIILQGESTNSGGQIRVRNNSLTNTVLLKGSDSNYQGGYFEIKNSSGTSTIYGYGHNGSLVCTTLTQTSLAEKKKNFEKLDNALDIVKDTDIYKYNLKDEKETDKKHIGFVIGENFNYRKEITSQRNDGAELYSMISVLWKAVQEQQEEIEELRKLVNK